MASIARVVKKFTHQTLVYWQKVGSDNYGKPSYAAPVEIACRWEDSNREIVTKDNRKVLAKVRLLLVSEVTVGSWVFLGTLAQIKTLPGYPNPPTFNQGGREIIVDDVTPDLKAQGFVYEAYA